MQGKRWSSLQLANLWNSSIVCASILLCKAKPNFTKWHSQIPNADSQVANCRLVYGFLVIFLGPDEESKSGLHVHQLLVPDCGKPL